MHRKYKQAIALSLLTAGLAGSVAVGNNIRKEQEIKEFTAFFAVPGTEKNENNEQVIKNLKDLGYKHFGFNNRVHLERDIEMFMSAQMEAMNVMMLQILNDNYEELAEQ